MLVRASIEPLSWENTFFGVNSAIVRFDQRAPVLTTDALLPWSRVQAKIPAGSRQHAKHGDHLAEVTRLPHASRAKRHRQQLHDQQTCTDFYQRTGRRP